MCEEQMRSTLDCSNNFDYLFNNSHYLTTLTPTKTKHMASTAPTSNFHTFMSEKSEDCEKKKYFPVTNRIQEEKDYCSNLLLNNLYDSMKICYDQGASNEYLMEHASSEHPSSCSHMEMSTIECDSSNLHLSGDETLEVSGRNAKHSIDNSLTLLNTDCPLLMGSNYSSENVTEEKNELGDSSFLNLYNQNQNFIISSKNNTTGFDSMPHENLSVTNESSCLKAPCEFPRDEYTCSLSSFNLLNPPIENNDGSEKITHVFSPKKRRGRPKGSKNKKPNYKILWYLNCLRENKNEAMLPVDCLPKPRDKKMRRLNSNANVMESTDINSYSHSAVFDFSNENENTYKNWEYNRIPTDTLKSLDDGSIQSILYQDSNPPILSSCDNSTLHMKNSVPLQRTMNSNLGESFLNFGTQNAIVGSEIISAKNNLSSPIFESVDRSLKLDNSFLSIDVNNNNNGYTEEDEKKKFQSISISRFEPCVICGKSGQSNATACVCRRDTCHRIFCLTCLSTSKAKGRLSVFNCTLNECIVCVYQSRKRSDADPNSWHFQFKDINDGYFIRTLRDVLPSADGLFIEISRTRQPCWRRKLRNKARKHFSFRFYGGVFESRLEALDVSRHDEANLMNVNEAILPPLSPASMSNETICTPMMSPCTLRLQKCSKDDPLLHTLSPTKVLPDKSQLIDFRKSRLEKLNYSSPYMNSMPSDSSTYYSLESDTGCEKFVQEHFVKSEKKEIFCFHETKLFQRPLCSYETTNKLFETQENISDYNASRIQNSLVDLDHLDDFKNFSNKYSCPSLTTEKYKNSLNPSSSTTVKEKDCLEFFVPPGYPESYTAPYAVEKYPIPSENSNNIVDGSYSPSYSLYTPYHTLQELLKI